ncbi:MAG: N-acetyl-gamma-glutamyl-phosphate reductase [Bacteroidales bacterium]|jgi:N-acetyl-gamma-glutamyl-phosphate reductase|nr:N-acetyl-gamma-glutamyl-phosphate reductase [Bacteroidales bacterium]MDY0358241.1 N-acetyl-gamma-glutamyl-phosphate reductase [Bacteroidales bacterium]NLN36356.1 N-acetyl-gamma-glutamyl-phosphate reductase [Bacteroidales bacterium]
MKTNNKISVAIAGGAGYTGGELIRLLLLHPGVSLVSILSDSQAGKSVASIHRDLAGESLPVFEKELPDVDIRVLFLCLGHDRARAFLQDNKLDKVHHIIDLSQDFRHQGNREACGRKFVYGLPESCLDPAEYAGSLHLAGNVANPGCFATAIELALLPLARAGLLKNDVHVHAITGATGAGSRLSETSHFPYRNNNLAVYKAFGHQHIKEIRETLSGVSGNGMPPLHFIPVRGDFPRGILASAYTSCNIDREQAVDLYREYYRLHPFVRVSEEEISMKEVVNTNKCSIHVQKHGHMIHITSVIDNLLKGASGTAVQNMNLLTGMPQTSGLHLKSIVY